MQLTGNSSASVLYLDGAFLPLAEGRVSVEDRGFQFGDGVYEVFKVMNGCALWLEEHLGRLAASLDLMGIRGVLEAHPFGAIVPEVVERSRVLQGTVYLQATRGCAPRSFEFPGGCPATVLAYATPADFPPPAEIRAGIRVHAIQDFRWGRCDIKSLQLLAAVMGKEQAHAAGADEVVWVGPDGQIREGGSSNVFAVIHGQVVTPPLGTAVLAGVTRMKVLEEARAMGMNAAEQPFSLDQMCAADEAFITSTTRDVMPIVAVGGRRIGTGAPGKVTLALADAIRVRIARVVGGEAPAAVAGAV